MDGLQTTICVSLLIWLVLNIYNECLQMSINLKQYKHTKEFEDAIKNLENVMDDATKGIARDKFFNDFEELMKREIEENKEDKGDKE